MIPDITLNETIRFTIGFNDSEILRKFFDKIHDPFAYKAELDYDQSEITATFQTGQEELKQFRDIVNAWLIHHRTVNGKDIYRLYEPFEPEPVKMGDMK